MISRIWKYLLLVIILCIVLWTGWPAYQGYMNTEYSSYYREDHFLDISVGDSENDVIGLLGAPLADNWYEGQHVLDYSLPKGTGYYYQRQIIFEDSKVIDKKNRLTN